MRVLGRVRISRATDESTSVERQREIIEAWAKANEHQIVGWAEDLDISGGIDPFDTPALGDWLTNRADQFDICAAWKLDRLGRDSIRLNKLFGWAIDNGKTIVSCTEGIDLSTPVGRLIANVIAFLAEGERELIRERTKASQKKLREVGRWRGGKPIYGYEAVERADGAGWELQPDPHTSKVLQQIIDKVLSGQSTQSIATELTEAAEPAPADHLRIRAGKPIKGSKWSNTGIRTLLRSKTLLGHSTHEGQTVRDANGDPVLIGPPLVTQDQFDKVQAFLDGTANKITNRSAKASPLLGVLLCGAVLHEPGCTSGPLALCGCPPCGRLMHLRQNHSKARGKTYRYYQCLGGGNAGGGGGTKDHETNIITAEDAEEWLEEHFLTKLGDEPEQLKVFVPAEDHTAQLADAVRAADELTALLGTLTSETMKTLTLSQLDALDKRITKLEKLPSREASWRYENAPHTYRDEWEKLDTEGRRQMLLRSEIKLHIYRHPGTNGLRSVLYTPENLRELLAR
jgi:site-specific DNA recombinase